MPHFYSTRTTRTAVMLCYCYVTAVFGHRQKQPTVFSRACSQRTVGALKLVVYYDIIPYTVIVQYMNTIWSYISYQHACRSTACWYSSAYIPGTLQHALCVRYHITVRDYSSTDGVLVFVHASTYSSRCVLCVCSHITVRCLYRRYSRK